MKGTVFALLAAFCLLPSAKATPITFTYTGTATGTLGGVSTSAAFTLTALGDTANLGIFPGSTSLDIAPVTATFTWGASSGTILGSLDWFNNPNGVTGLNLGFGSDLFDFTGNAATASWDMASSIGPVVIATGGTNGSVSTDAGSLVVSSISPFTFQATVSAASVPERSTGFAVIAGVGLLVASRLRRS